MTIMLEEMPAHNQSNLPSEPLRFWRTVSLVGEEEIKLKGKLAITAAITLCLGVIMILVSMAMAQEVPKITKEEVKRMLGNADVIIVDVRLGRDWDGSKLKIKGAVREDPRNIGSWIDKYPQDKTLIFYCA